MLNDIIMDQNYFYPEGELIYLFILQQLFTIRIKNLTFFMNTQKFLPILYATGAIMSFVTMQVFVKLLSHQMTTQYIIQIRSVFLLAFNSVLVIASADYQSYSQPKSEFNEEVFFVQHQVDTLYFLDKLELMLMIKRQILSTITVNIYLCSLKYINISIANALYNTTPVLTFFVQAIYYKKSLNRIHLILAFISFVGVLLMINPFGHISSTNFDPYILLPLLAATINCLNFIYLHQMRGYKEVLVLQYTYTFHLLSNSLLSTLSGGVSALPSSQSLPYSVSQVILLCALIIIFTYASNYLRIMAIFKRKPSQILVFNYVGIIYSIILDVYFFKNNIDWITILGVLLTSTGLLSQIMVSCTTQKL